MIRKGHEGDTTGMKGSWHSRALLFLVAGGFAAEAASSGLAGSWSCPTTLQVAAVGQTELTVEVNTRADLGPEGRYESEGEAIVRLGRWPLTLAATSHGRWLHEQQDVTITVEALELSPGSAFGAELQRQVAQQLASLLPPTTLYADHAHSRGNTDAALA